MRAESILKKPLVNSHLSHTRYLILGLQSTETNLHNCKRKPTSQQNQDQISLAQF